MIYRVVATIITYVLMCGTATAQTAVFGEITIEGNTSTGTDLILKELSFAPGDPLDYDKVDQDWEHLEDLGWFAFVEIELDETSQDVVPVMVLVEEDRSTLYYPIIAFDRRHDIRLGAKVYDINLRGRGERLSFSGIWYRQHRYDASWSHPWLFGVGGLSWGLAAHWEDAPFVFRDFDYRRHGGAAWLRWERPRPFFTELRAARSSFRQGDSFAGAPVDWNAGQRRRWSLSAVVGIDNRDVTHYPSRGAYHTIVVTRHISDDFTSFNEVVGDLRQFLSLPWKHILCLHAWGRRVGGHLPPEDLLFWGGAENLRGHDYASFEGEEGWLLSAEYRWPLFMMPISADGRVIGIGFHAFGDLGANWYDGDTAEPRHDYGLGLHIGLSNQQFRFEAARTDAHRTVFQFLNVFNF